MTEVGTYELSDEQRAVLHELDAEFPSEFRVGHEAAGYHWLDNRIDDGYDELVEGCLGEVGRALEDMFVAQGLGSVVVSRTLEPATQMGDTPLRHNHPDRALWTQPDIYRHTLMRIFNRQFYAYGFTTQQDSVIANHIVALPELEAVPGTASSRKGIDFHTEDASMNRADPDTHREEGGIAPDYLLNHFIYNPYEVPILVSAVRLEALGEQVLALLQEPVYEVQTNRSHGLIGNDSLPPNSLVYQHEGQLTPGPSFRFNSVFLDPSNYLPPYREAITAFLDGISAEQTAIRAKPGDLVINKNLGAGMVAHAKAPEPAGAPLRQPRGRFQIRSVYAEDVLRLKPHLVDGDEAAHVVDTQLFIDLHTTQKP